VDDIEKALAGAKQKGLRLIDERPRIGFGGNKIAFVHPSGMHGVLVELVEEPK
jgi:methylmalonyl-CoA/ethylmalonyl-CoA epimerase